MEEQLINTLRDRISETLNSGIITAEPGDFIGIEIGDSNDDRKKIHSLARDLNRLDDMLALCGFDVLNRLPTEEDADGNGNVLWLQGSYWMPGKLSAGKPDDATRWKRTHIFGDNDLDW